MFGGARKFTRLKRFQSDTRGAALVEFAAVLPFMLLMFVFIVEGTRLIWTHQLVVSGVRDGARYVARIAPRDVCSTTNSIAPFTGTLANIVSQSSTAANILPGSVTVNNVTGTLTCVNGITRINPAGVATVTADISIQYPFAMVFSLFGNAPQTLTYTVSDMARIHGE